MRKDLLGGVLVVVAAASFGLMPLFARHAYAAGVDVQTLLFLRFTIAAVVLVGCLAATKRLIWPGLRVVAWLTLLGGVLYALQATLYFSAVRVMSPTLAVLLLYLYPALVMGLSATITRVRPSAKQLAAIVLSLAGMVLVLGAPTGSVQTVGVLLALGAALTYAVYIMVGDRFSGTLPPFTTAAYVITFAALSFAVTGLARGGMRLAISGPGWTAVIAVAVVCTIVAIGCFFAGMALIGPVRAAILGVVEPIVSVAAAAIALGETITPLQAVGGGCVLVAAVWGSRTPAPPPDRLTTADIQR